MENGPVTRRSSKLSSSANSSSSAVHKQASKVDEAVGVYQKFANFLHFTAIPLALVLSVTVFVMLLIATVRIYDGSYLAVLQSGVWPCVQQAFATASISSTAVAIVAVYMLFAVLLMLIVPGEIYDGPTTPRGNVPKYRNNGFRCYLVTMVTFVGATWAAKRLGYSPTIVYDLYFDVVLVLNLAAHLLCTALYLKGRFAPSSNDSGCSGNVVFDYYWGTELHPRFGPVDVKVYTNCRFGMTVWALLVCIFAMKAFELHGYVPVNVAVSTLLQLAYITKFFWWEDGYMRTIDIMVDRAGFYICWGCLTFVPTMYTSTSHYLVSHPIDYSWQYGGAVLLIGLLSIYLNYACDAQRQTFRATQGKCTIWGREPLVIKASYVTEDGKKRENLLLASGYWGLARHFNYVFELALAFCWSVMGGFDNFFPYTYFFVLSILLAHRSVRDDRRCRERYGSYWAEYCRIVKYRIVPYVF